MTGLDAGKPHFKKKHAKLISKSLNSKTTKLIWNLRYLYASWNVISKCTRLLLIVFSTYVLGIFSKYIPFSPQMNGWLAAASHKWLKSCCHQPLKRSFLPFTYVVRSHRRRVPSQAPDRANCPSEEITTSLTKWEWPFRERWGMP